MHKTIVAISPESIRKPVSEMKPYLFILLYFLLILPWAITSIAARLNVSKAVIVNPVTENLQENSRLIRRSLSGINNDTAIAASSDISETAYVDPIAGPLLENTRSVGRSLLSLLGHDNDKQGNILLAFLDGTIALADTVSKEILWSFSSGSPIYSSYQAPFVGGSDNGSRNGLDGSTESRLNSFLDLGDDGLLYEYDNITKKRTKLEMPPSEYVNSLPHISRNGEVTIGSKKTTVSIFDFPTGLLLQTYTSGNSDEEMPVPSTQDYKNMKDRMLLYVIRTDNTVQRYDSHSNLICSVAFSEFVAFLQFNGDSKQLASTSQVPVFRIENPETAVRLFYPDIAIHARPNSPKLLPANPYQWENHKGKNSVGHSLPIFSGRNPYSLATPSSPNHHSLAILSSPDPHSLSIASSPKFQYTPDQVENHEGRYCDDCDKAITTFQSQNELISTSLDYPNVDQSYRNSNTWRTGLSSVALTLSACLTWLWYIGRLPAGRHNQSSNQLTESKTNAAIGPKRKKARKLLKNKNNANSERNIKNLFEDEENSNGFHHIEGKDKYPLLHLTKSLVNPSDGRMVGKLFVSNIEIAKGSNGTVVLEGNYEGRSVAVKRLVKAHHDVAIKEIQNLIASDRHPNIIRWYGVEHDSDFVYLSLERCICSLDDLVRISVDSSQRSASAQDQNANSIDDYNVRLDLIKGIDKDMELWKANGYPAPNLLKLMRDVVSGLAHLHELGIVHRDLKPQNVLILQQRSLCAKLSDMGISKCLTGDMSSFSHHATGYGSSGWQAPEQLLHGRQTRAVDVFSLGCVLFFCITGGKHPFGDRLERDINIVNNRVDLFLVEHIPEAVDLFSNLLNSNPELRPKAFHVQHHPLFWNSETRLSFLRDTSDRVELEDRESDSDLLKALEEVAPVALGGKWDEKMEAAFMTNIGRYRRYKYDSARDLLRVIRNKLNHYRELPKDIQDILGSVPEGFDSYFASRFPKFLIEVYNVMYKHCREETCFSKYFNGDLI